MKLRDISFNPVLSASGAMGFKGDNSEYLHHGLMWPLAPDFEGMTFVAKTVTLFKREKADGANMELDVGLRPVELFPKCIAINWWTCETVNAVGLANCGILQMLGREVWQAKTEPFVISFMSVAPTAEERIIELHRFIMILKDYLPYFNAPFALQINFSCPNAGINPMDLISEVASSLDVAGILGVPIMPKFSISQMTVESALEISKHEHCDAICMSNTIPWFGLPQAVQVSSFGSVVSPLIKRGLTMEGGYSGPYMYPLVLDWVRRYKKAGGTKHINAGGGIFSKSDIKKLYLAGADSVFLGSVCMLRPWRVQELITYGNTLFPNK